MIGRSNSGPRILGVDPGSRITGYGCVDVSGSDILHVCHGAIKLVTDGADTLESRLFALFENLRNIIESYKPDILVIERVFFAKNVMSALKLGHARGVILLSGAQAGLEIAEYSATEIKSALTGFGRSQKQTVAQFVKWVVGDQEFSTYDASDALAVAICHARHLQTQSRARSVPQISRQARELFRKTASKKKMSLAESLGHAAQRAKPFKKG